MARWSRSFVAGLLVLPAALLACSGATEPAPPRDITGTYVLVSVDGQPLPYDVSYVSGYSRRVEMLEGTVEIRADRTFLDHSVTRFWRRDGSGWTDRPSDAAGTATLEDGAIKFQDLGGAVYRMQLDGEALVQRWFIYDLRYERQ